MADLAGTDVPVDLVHSYAICNVFPGSEREGPWGNQSFAVPQTYIYIAANETIELLAKDVLAEKI